MGIVCVFLPAVIPAFRTNTRSSGRHNAVKSRIGVCLSDVIVMKISNSYLLQHIFVYSGVFTRDDFEGRAAESRNRSFWVLKDCDFSTRWREA